MATNKKAAFEEIENSLAAFANALSHPARIRILQILADRKQCVCGEIVEVLPLAQSTVSQHLQELKKADLIKGSIDGAKSCYCINWETFEKMQLAFALFAKKIGDGKNENTCC